MHFWKRGAIFIPLLLIVVGAGALAGAFFAGRGSIDRKSDTFLGTAARTLGEMFQTGDRKPVLEIDLDAPRAERGEYASEKAVTGPQKSGGAEKTARKDSASEKTPKDEAARRTEMARCDFSRVGSPHHRVLINEIAWMGSETSPSDEWIELRNNSGENISLRGWRILSSDGAFETVFNEKDAVAAGGFFLLERSDDDAVPNVSADKLYSGAVSNAGEHLRLFDGDCALADEIDASAGWPAGGNKTKLTLERNVRDFGWHASAAAGGTPKQKNDDFMPSPSASAPGAPSGSSSTSPQPPSSSPPLSPPKVFISEIFYDAEGNDAGKEFVELYNAGSVEIDMTNWSLTANGSSLGKFGSKSEDRVRIAPSGYFLVGLSSWTGTPAADVKRSSSLPNSGATIALLDANGTMDSVTYAEGATQPGQSVSRVSWDAAELRAQAPDPRSSGF